MPQRLPCRLVCVALVFLLIAAPVAGAVREPPLQDAAMWAAGAAPQPPPLALRGKIDPQALREVEDAGSATFLVHLREQASLPSAAPLTGKAEQRRRVYDSLRQTAARSQAPLIAELERARAAGEAQGYRSFYIFNGLAVTGTRELLLRLAARPDVAAIRANHRYQLPEAGAGAGEADPAWNLERIRATLASEAFGIDGRGVVVANIDTGVDWTHPALQSHYRGFDPADPGASTHDYNWFDATRTYPNAPGPNAAHLGSRSDHGTHTMGIIVGQEPGGANRVGVAPGARWIAARAFDNEGQADDVALHACFEWLLAPSDLHGQNPDPTLAPDIVSNSWGSSESTATTFYDDIRAWRAAGILPVFAAGNEGPGSHTIDTPAGYPEVLAVGATDSYDRIATLSSRGPSPWQEIKPDVCAPGINIRSTFAGGTYEILSGTSMAAPHVAGLVALIYQAASEQPAVRQWPPLSYTATAQIVTSSAVDLGMPGPDTAYGWGRIDAYQAVGAAANGGTFRGRIVDAQTRAPIAGATITMVNRRFGGSVQARSDAHGDYVFTVAAGQYDVTAAHYYYHPFTASLVDILANTTTRLDFALSPLPTGAIEGYISDLASGAPLTATISIVGTPASASSDARGYYRLVVPAGRLDLRIWPSATGHRAAERSGVTVVAGRATRLDFALSAAPRILFVDADTWRSSAEAAYYQADLTALLYPFDTWSVAGIPDDVPPPALLGRYDLVIWSQSESSPGYIGGWDGLGAYLAQGGRLLISGQNIGYWDSYRGYGAGPYTNLLHARYLIDDAGLRQVYGLDDSPFAGQTLDLNSPDSAGNQYSPSEIAAYDAYARPVLAYQGLAPRRDAGPQNDPGGLAAAQRLGDPARGTRAAAPASSPSDLAGGAALSIETCSYRALYLAFGLGGAGGEQARRRVLEKSILTLTGPRPELAFNLFSPAPLLSCQPGTPVSFRLALANRGRSDVQLDVQVLRSTWPAALLDADLARPVSSSGVLGPCALLNLSLRVEVPLTAVAGAQSTTRLRVSPRGQPAAAQEIELAAMVLPSWAAASPLPAPRYRLAAAGLGCAVYVVGGFAADNRVVAPVLRYDVSSGAWTRLADKPSPAGNIALASDGRRLYALGGYDQSGATLDAVEVYDPASGRWSLETRLPQPLSGAAAAFYDGLLYVMGGATPEQAVAEVWAYDPAARTWQARAPLPGGPRAFAGAALLDDGIYLAGGWPALRTVERYDPRSNTWISLPPLAQGRQGAAVAGAGGRLYVAGGGNQWSGLTTVECFDPALGRWLAAPELTVRERAGSAAALAGGRLFVLGGTSQTGTAREVESLLVGSSPASSTLQASSPEARPGETITYTLILRNPGDAPLAGLRVAAPLPPATHFRAGSASGGCAFDAATQSVTWQGMLAARSGLALGYAVQVDPLATNGTLITGTVSLQGDPCGSHTLVAVTRILDADLRSSRLSLTPALALPGDLLTCALTIENAGPLAGEGLAVANPLPDGVSLVPGSLSGGARYSPLNRTLTWNGDVPAASGRKAAYQDSDDGDVVFDWIDAQPGTRVPLADDGSAGPFPLGFSLRFYDSSYDRFYINSNGMITFGGETRDYANTCLPNAEPPHNLIAAFWDDLDTSGQGAVYYRTVGAAPRRQTVVQWSEVPLYADPGSRLTFQIVLCEENQEIRVQYLRLEGVGAAGQSATVGIENADGTAGLCYLCNGEPAGHALHDRLAVRLLPPLPETPSRQTIGYQLLLDPALRPSTIISNLATLTWRGRSWPLGGEVRVAWVDLGSSQMSLAPAALTAGERLTGTLSLRNTGNYAAARAAVELPLPPQLAFVPGSGSAGLVYDVANRRLAWEGSLAPGATQSLRFGLASAPLAAPGGITLTAHLRDGYGQSWSVAAAGYLLGDALGGSRLEASPAAVLPGQVLTYTIYIQNSGPQAQIVLSDALPRELTLLEETLWASTGEVAWREGAVRWAGTLSTGELALVRFRVRVGSQVPIGSTIVNTVRLDDGRTVSERRVSTQVCMYRAFVHLPWAGR